MLRGGIVVDEVEDSGYGDGDGAIGEWYTEDIGGEVLALVARLEQSLFEHGAGTGV